MTEHNHYQVLKGSLLLLPGLVLILALETTASFSANQLAINAHSFDILSDVLAFLVVIIGSAFSGFLDDRGRSHRQTHREQRLIAGVNLVVLWSGATLVMVRSVLSIDEPTADQELSRWWVLAGPALAILIYFWIGRRLQNFSVSDLTTTSLQVHIKGDVFIAILATTLSALTLGFQRDWINVVGGIIMALVLYFISLELVNQLFYGDRFD